MTSPDTPQPGATRSARSLLAVASIAVALAAADTYVVVLALTDMMAGVGIGIESLQRGTPIISGFLLGYVAVLPLIGRLADLIARRRILLACLAIFVVGSLVTGIAVELPVMIGGRFLQGLGGGGLVPATLAIVADLWPPGRRGTPLGVVGAVQELGSVLGPLLGAAILLVTDWRGIFWFNAIAGVLLAVGIGLIRPPAVGGTGGQPAGADPGAATASPPERPARARVISALAWVSGVVAALCLSLALIAPDPLVRSVQWGAPFVPLDPLSPSRLLTQIGLIGLGAALLTALLTARRWLPVLLQADLLGAAFVAIALGSLILTFSSADPSQEVLGPWGLWLLPLAGAAIAAFWWRQRTARHPLIPSGTVRRRVAPALIVSLFVGVALVAIVVDVPLLARLTPGISETQAAFRLLEFLVAVPIGAVVGGLALRRWGPALIAGPGLLLAAGALGYMATWERGAIDGFGWSAVPLAAAGLGIGLAIAPVNDAALADARQDSHGAVSSLVVVARMTGMVVGLALLTAVGLRRFTDAVALLPDPQDEDAYLDAAVIQVQTVFAGAAICALVAAVVALIWLGRRPVVAPDAQRAALPLGG